MPSLLIVGAGHVGRHLARALPDATLFPGRMADLRSIATSDDTIVVCAAGKTDLAWCERFQGEAFWANVAEPVALARRVLAAGLRYLHLSSGCVWDGPYKPDGYPFGPTDPATNPCVYAQTKAECDARLIALNDGSRRIAVLRPRQVYSQAPHPRNTLTKLRGYAALLDTPNSMTSADTIAKTIAALAADAQSPLWGRVACVYDRGVATPYQVGVRMARTGLRPPPTILAKSDLDIWHKPRRVDTVLADPGFEVVVDPPEVLPELDRVIAQYATAAV